MEPAALAVREDDGDLNTGDEVQGDEEGYESFENPQDVLIASGFHNQVGNKTNFVN